MAIGRVRSASYLALFVVGLASAAAAETPAPTRGALSGRGDEGAQPASLRAAGSTPASAAAEAGLLLPATIAPSVFPRAVYASVRSGYDGAGDAFVARAVAEGGLTSWLALRLDYEHGPSMGPDDHLRVGARVAFLNQAEHGVDAGAALFYDPKDFRAEGNIVGGLLLGRQFGRLGLFADALVGSDPEGDDGQLELRVASLYRVSLPVQIGIDARVRYNMSSDEKRAGTQTTDWQLQALPGVSWSFDDVALVADVGVTAAQTKGPFAEPTERTEREVGVLALTGVAGAF